MLASRRAVVPLLAFIIVAASAADAGAGSGGTNGIDTSGDVPTVHPTTVGLEHDNAPTDPDRAPSVDPGGTSAATGGGTSGADTVEKEVAVAPVIHCLWATSDMDPATPGVQRGQLEVADDLPDVPTPTPCGTDPESGAPVTVPTSDPLTHVRPWSADDPGLRVIEIWMIVSHAVGPGSIDGTEISVDGLDLKSADEPVAADFGTAVQAGVVSGQLTSTAAVDLEQLVIDGWGIAVRSTLQLSYLDGCGRVAISGSASAGDETSTVSAAVDVPCYHHLLADFDEVTWGSLVRGAETVVSGDHDRSTSDRPTLFNAGNTPIVLATTFAPLCSIADPQQCMGDFGIEVTGTDGIVHRNDPAPPGEELLTPEPVICPGDALRVDVLVRTPDTAAGGEYVGSMDMVGRNADADCAGRPEPTTSGPQSTDAPTASPGSTP